MKNRLFWKLGTLHLLLLLLVLASVDLYVARALKKEFLNAAYAQLESLARVALANPPQSADSAELREWAADFGRSNDRVTLIAEDGKVELLRKTETINSIDELEIIPERLKLN